MAVYRELLDAVCHVIVSGKNGALPDWSIWTFQQTQVSNEGDLNFRSKGTVAANLTMYFLQGGWSFVCIRYRGEGGRTEIIIRLDMIFTKK